MNMGTNKLNQGKWDEIILNNKFICKQKVWKGSNSVSRAPVVLPPSHGDHTCTLRDQAAKKYQHLAYMNNLSFVFVCFLLQISILA